MTDHAEYRCIVQERADGQPWIVFEPRRGKELAPIKRRVLGMDLRPDTTMAEAHQLARQLARHVVGLSLTDHLRIVGEIDQTRDQRRKVSKNCVM